MGGQIFYTVSSIFLVWILNVGRDTCEKKEQEKVSGSGASIGDLPGLYGVCRKGDGFLRNAGDCSAG